MERGCSLDSTLRKNFEAQSSYSYYTDKEIMRQSAALINFYAFSFSVQLIIRLHPSFLELNHKPQSWLRNALVVQAC